MSLLLSEPSQSIRAYEPLQTCLDSEPIEHPKQSRNPKTTAGPTLGLRRARIGLGVECERERERERERESERARESESCPFSFVGASASVCLVTCP